jgi:hypothetical protein
LNFLLIDQIIEMRRKILFITGSMNQTSQMYQISKHLEDYDCWFSQVFPNSSFLDAVLKYTPLVNGTPMADHHRAKAENFLKEHGLKIDYKGYKNEYDLVVYCSDMVIDNRFKETKTIWVQEGMVDKRTLLTDTVKALGIPPYFTADTSLNGCTNICDIYCTASEGYKSYFAKHGTDPAKLIVTGIPNYDNDRQFLNNDFPHRNYVMVATTDMRETYRFENRRAFIKRAVKIADGRQLLFKLHPNEKFARAEAEIRKYTPPDTLIYNCGNTSHMIANCCELITQYSTVVYTGIALGKKVHSYFDIDELKKLAPLQNGGASAKNIAQICSSYIKFTGNKEDFLAGFTYQPERVQHLKMRYA